ncbi:hypothetical protein RHS04_09277 [Rhizoctonia solani]|uniref:Uncharacterized protein n=1 Tax=Rhizoctonia solani TaxID=456999 RepID=A0A8H7LFM0_9AGAM|nr:hypothetical protein RHS04_09277 [Rhizoctonia solani]
MLVTRSCIVDPNPSPDSLEVTPLVTPNSPDFPSLGSAVELVATDAPARAEYTKPYTSIFAPVPKPLPLRPSFGVDLTSPTRRRASDGRLREPSAGGEERAKALGTVRKMLEELRVSPDQQSIPPSLTKNGAWTPMDLYIPPWKLNRSRESTSKLEDTSNSSATKQVPKVNLNDETLEEDEQLAMLEDLDKEETKTTVWDSIHEAVRVVEKLEGPNWPSWSFWIQRKVCRAKKNIWGHIDGSRSRESSDEWDADETAIHCALLSSLNFDIISDQVRSCTTAKEVWDLLELLYKDKPTPESRAVDLIREMTRMTYFEGHDIQHYLHRFEGIVDELNQGPYPIPLELAKQFVLGSLPGALLKDMGLLRTKEHTSIQDLCQDIMMLKKETISEDCSSVTSQHNVGACLPLDLRYYKYTGGGVLPDGTLYLRAKKTCGACLSFGHKAYAPDCPQTEARLGLWGSQKDAQRPWDRRSAHRPDWSETSNNSRQALGVYNGRVSRPTTPGGGRDQERMRAVSGGPDRTRTTSAGWMSARSGRISPISKVPSGSSGVVSSRSGNGLSAIELDSWR